MWLLSSDKKRDMDNDVFVCAVFTSIKPGLGKSTCFIASKKEGLDAICICVSFPSQNPPSPAGFGASLLHIYTNNQTQKVVVPEPNNLTVVEYHNT